MNENSKRDRIYFGIGLPCSQSECIRLLAGTETTRIRNHYYKQIDNRFLFIKQPSLLTLSQCPTLGQDV